MTPGWPAWKLSPSLPSLSLCDIEPSGGVMSCHDVSVAGTSIEGSFPASAPTSIGRSRAERRTSMGNTEPQAPQARWVLVAQRGLPLLGSAFVLGFALFCGLVVL